MTGASPVSASSTSTVGNRLRSSPISAISAAATTGPMPVKDRKIGASGCRSSSSADLVVEGPEMVGVHPQLVGEQVRRERLPGRGARAGAEQMRLEPVDEDLRFGSAAVAPAGGRTLHPARPDPSGLVRGRIGADELQR